MVPCSSINQQSDFETLNMRVRECALPSDSERYCTVAYLAWRKNMPICPEVFAVVKDLRSGGSEVMVLVQPNDLAYIYLAAELVQFIVSKRTGPIIVNPDRVQNAEFFQAFAALAGNKPAGPSDTD